MHAVAFLFLVLLALPALAADSLQTALQLYQAGSPRLALARVVRDQPQQIDPVGQTSWYEWESLRLTLLSETRQAEEILARAKLYPSTAARDFQQKALGHKVWAQLELKQSVMARAALARLIWQFDLNAADQKWARRLVIRSYLLDHKPDEAYRAMLRYQQDFQPLPKEVLAEFVHGLLAEEYISEAVTWLTELDAASPALLALQTKAGLIAPNVALVQARTAQQKKQNAAAYAPIVVEAAKLMKDERQQIDALEQWLNIAEFGAETPDFAKPSQQLWQVYQREAERLGNQAQVLRGDDSAWLSLASRLSSDGSTEDRLGARAIYAYIAQHGGDLAQRETAQGQLYAALVTAQLTGAAVRLFAAAPWRGDRMSDAEFERILAQLTVGMPDVATRKFYFTAARLQEVRKNPLAAADYFAQTVLKSDLRQPDDLAREALQRARSNLEQAGYKEDAEVFYRRVMAQQAPALKPVSSKVKRKK